MGTGALEAAREYLREGWRVVPIPHGKKKPIGNEWQRLRLEEAELPSRFRNGENIGVLLGEPSGGLTDLDLDSREAVALADSFLPATPRCHDRPGNPDSHRWYRAPNDQGVKRYEDPTDRSVLLELRSTGGQTVVPPSIHPDGDELRWIERGAPAEVPYADLRAAVERLAAAALLARHWPVKGSRDQAALALAGALTRRGWAPAKADGFVVAVARVAGDEESAERAKAERTATKRRGGGHTYGWPRVVEIFGKKITAKIEEWLALDLERIEREAKTEEEQAEHHFQFTDLGNAERFAHENKHQLRYVEGLGWHVYDGPRWTPDRRAAERLAQGTVRSMLARAAGLEGAQRKELATHALRSERRERLAAMLALAESHRDLHLEPEDLDADPQLLNVENGTIHLPTGKLLSHDPARRLSRLAPVKYDPAATCPTWDRLLAWAFLGRAALIAFFQRCVGYCATGLVREHAWFLSHGGGGNAKTTIWEALLGVLGDYGARAMADVFLGRPGREKDVALGALAGVRLVLAAEPETGRTFRDGLLKAITGERTFTGWRMYHGPFTFPIQFKIAIYANHLPAVRDDSDAFWRRVHLLPFENQVAEANRDTRLGEKLRAEYPGILAWLVRGAVAYFDRGLGSAPEVVTATQHYREGEDSIRSFLADRCTLHPDAWVTSAGLFATYREWAARNGEDPGRQQDFTARILRVEGVREDRKKHARGFSGLELLVTGDAR